MNATAKVTFSMILCQLISETLKIRHLNHKELFVMTGMSQATWSRIAHGTTHFSIEDLRNVCTCLEYPMDQLVCEAEKVASALPKEDVEVEGKKQSIVAPVLAGAALGFLISRILS